MKKIIFELDGKKYTLEYTRRSIERMEQDGFKVQDIQDKPITMIPKLFHGAFFKNHQNITKHEALEIYARLDNKEELLTKLIELYSEPILSLMSNKEENKEGNVEWGMA